jgi:hypothetical protein
MVGSNKEDTNEFKANAAMVRAVAAMQTMANKKCPSAIKSETGDVVYFATDINGIIILVLYFFLNNCFTINHYFRNTTQC